MKGSFLLAIMCAALTAAIPTPPPDLTNFLLVTSTCSDYTANSSLLPNVNATSLFDPNKQETFLLRLIAPGYGSLPQFNISNSTLQTESYGPVGFTLEEYNSTTVTSGDELGFVPAVQTMGNLGLKDGYLLSVLGETEGWTVCDGAGAIGQSVIFWKGEDESCEPRYVHAVQTAPY
ncbi:uncharacterized protein RCC_01977 [Ramularia collo-cygni]|uniref:Uncharacterized protein n=1 Tax=Ramularia collo-cygni TaxID=112498 RepID=A0A2D3UY89_9PEZI|nr:uncharacterized protein RCC_01977 [Ramularia collo-cygni]CZT16136.1 uncharacterized protein RCC_01977 [Ramularia collo-cygni]